MTQGKESLNGLAADILEQAFKVMSYLEDNGLHQPSLAGEGVAQYPETPLALEARMRLIGSLENMLQQVQGGHDEWFWQTIPAHYDISVLNVLNQFDFWSAVPLSGSASFSSISAHTRLPEDLVRRFLRYAVTINLFSLTENGARVCHTGRSALFVQRPGARSLLGHNLEECYLAAASVPEALRRHSLGKDLPAQDLDETGFALAFSNRTFWDVLENDGEGDRKGFRSTRFSSAMKAAKEMYMIDFTSFFQSAFDWESIGEGTVVDVGGSQGHDAVTLARTNPKLKIIVQDLPAVEPAFNANVPADLGQRVSFMPHDFFTPQTVSADVYLLKAILHDWADRHAARILAALASAMQPGSRIILVEFLLPEFGSEEWRAQPLSVQRRLATMDMQMHVLFNAKERTVEDWKALARQADGRLEVVKAQRFRGTMLGSVEICFRD